MPDVLSAALPATTPLLTDPVPVALPGRCPTCNSLAGYHWTIDQHRYAALLGRARLLSYLSLGVAGGSLLTVAVLAWLLLAR